MSVSFIMSSWLCLLVAFVAFQAVVRADGTACGKAPHSELILTGNRRWYFCKTTGSTSNGGCFLDVEPDGFGLLSLKMTKYNRETQQLEVKTFNITEAENIAPPGPNAKGVEFAHTEDKNCMLRMHCHKSSTPTILFMCREKSGCEDGTHDKFIEEKIEAAKKLEGMEELGAKMENYYDEKNCGQ